MSNTVQIAIYGKGGIGKSTIAANVSAALGQSGRRVLQVGCDPKHDSTRLLLRGVQPPTILDYIRDTPPEQHRIDDIILPGEFGIDCAEAGGPEPGIGCAGRGILTTFDLLERLGVRQRGYDAIVYDVLGDVVCGGFAVPIRNEYADKVYVITSGEFMSIYAANNILRGLKNYETGRPRVGGIIYNARGGDYEDERVRRFAEAVDLPIVEKIPRDDAFAAAERAYRCLVAEAPESELAALLRRLAEAVMEGPLYPARPLGDEELEERILGEAAGPGRAAVGGGGVGAGLAAGAGCGVAVAGGWVGAGRAAGTEAADAGSAGSLADDAAGCASRADADSAPADAPDSADAGLSTSSAAPAAAPLRSKAVANKEPLHGCAFNGAVSVTTQLADCVTIAHGPKSCTHITFQAITSISRRMLLERGIVLPMQTAPPIVSTDMNESVMIFGGTGELERHIREVQARRPAPPAIFVVSTCPSGIIGEDVLAAAALSTPECAVIPIAADGNLTGDHLQGVLMGYQHIAEGLIDRSLAPEPDLINIVAEKTIAESTTDNLAFLNEVCARLGIKVNCRFLCDSDYEQVRGFMRAPLNVLAYADYMGLALRDYLSESFGARFMDGPLPIGFAESARWLAELAGFYGRPEAAAPITADFEERYQAEVARLRPLLEGKRLMAVTFNRNIDWVLSAALDVGMELAFVGALEYSQDDRFVTELADSIGELHGDLDYTAMSRMADVERIKPDVLLGNYLPADGMNVPICDTLPLCPEAGFMSGAKMVARWAELTRMNLNEGWRQDADLYRKHCA